VVLAVEELLLLAAQEEPQHKQVQADIQVMEMQVVTELLQHSLAAVVVVLEVLVF